MFGSSLNPSQGGTQGTGNLGFGASGTGNPLGGFGSTNNAGFGLGSSNEKTGGSGLFGSGSSNVAKDNTQGGLFGGSGTTNTSGGTGLFGKSFGGDNSGSGSTTGGGLFGLNSGGGSFGQTGNQGSGGGGLFGNSGTGSGSTGGLFGGANSGNAAGSGGLFGNSGANKSSSVSGGLFGKTDTNTGNSGGLFGGGANNASTGNSGGLFGSNNSANTGSSGGLFGTGSGATDAGASGGLFGSGSANANTGATGGGLFGGSGTNTNTGGTSGGLFGGSGPNNNTRAPGSGLFGGSNAANTGTSGGLFGSGSITDKPASNLFSLANTNNTSNFLSQPQQMGQNAQAPFATSNLVKRGDNNTNQSNYTPAIHDQLLKIKEQWDPQSTKCLLKTHFYNKLTDLEVSSTLDQSRPANETPEDWDHAMSNRPGSQYYPMKVTSFTDVAQRIEVQLDHVARSRILLNNINEKQSSLSSKHDLDSTARILKAKAKHLKLLRRLLRLATVLAILKLKGYPLLPEEEEISKQFEILLEKLNDPGSSIGKLNDVFARLAILKERSQELNLQIDSSSNWANGGDNDLEDSRAEATSLDKGQYNETISKLSNMLFKQQIGLNHLNSILEADMEKVQNLKT